MVSLGCAHHNIHSSLGLCRLDNRTVAFLGKNGESQREFDEGYRGAMLRSNEMALD